MNQETIKKDQRIVIFILVLFVLSLLTSLIAYSRINGLIQFAIYFGYIAPLLLFSRLTPGMAYRLLPLIILIGIIQYPFDILLPRGDLFVLDSYTGTMAVANNKSRFLFMVILITLFFYRAKSSVINWLVFPSALLLMILSMKLGDSILYICLAY